MSRFQLMVGILLITAHLLPSAWANLDSGNMCPLPSMTHMDVDMVDIARDSNLDGQTTGEVLPSIQQEQARQSPSFGRQWVGSSGLFSKQTSEVGQPSNYISRKRKNSCVQGKFWFVAS
jgi:hypothetical protein